MKANSQRAFPYDYYPILPKRMKANSQPAVVLAEAGGYFTKEDES